MKLALEKDNAVSRYSITTFVCGGAVGFTELEVFRSVLFGSDLAIGMVCLALQKL